MSARRTLSLAGLASVAILLPTFGAPPRDDDDPAPVEVDILEDLRAGVRWLTGASPVSRGASSVPARAGVD